MENQQNNISNTPTESTPTPANVSGQTTAQHKVNILWPVILVVMVISLLVVLFLVYTKNAGRKMMWNENNYRVTRPQDDTTKILDLDKSKVESDVGDEVLNEIDQLEKTDVQSSYNDSQVNDLNGN